MRKPEEFVKICLDLFYNKVDFLTLLNKLDAEVIGKQCLLQNQVEGCEHRYFQLLVLCRSARPLEDRGQL
jgi:hypothetical protein